MESECLTSEDTSRIETGPKKRPHINKSGKCGSLISWNPVKENHKLSMKQTSRKERSPQGEKSKTQGTFDIMKCNFDKILLKWDIKCSI